MKKLFAPLCAPLRVWHSLPILFVLMMTAALASSLYRGSLILPTASDSVSSATSAPVRILSNSGNAAAQAFELNAANGCGSSFLLNLKKSGTTQLNQDCSGNVSITGLYGWGVVNANAATCTNGSGQLVSNNTCPNIVASAIPNPCPTAGSGIQVTGTKMPACTVAVASSGPVVVLQAEEWSWAADDNNTCLANTANVQCFRVSATAPPGSLASVGNSCFTQGQTIESTGRIEGIVATKIISGTPNTSTVTGYAIQDGGTSFNTHHSGIIFCLLYTSG